jgi:hypothetical protein
VGAAQRVPTRPGPKDPSTKCQVSLQKTSSRRGCAAFSCMADLGGDGEFPDGRRRCCRFVPATGVLARYVGDAFQPCTAHISIHGIPPMKQVNDPRSPVPRDSEEFKGSNQRRNAGGHKVKVQKVEMMRPVASIDPVNDAQIRLLLPTGRRTTALTLTAIRVLCKTSRSVGACCCRKICETPESVNQ